MATQSQLINAIKQANSTYPWNILKPVTTYSKSKHQYALRSTTMPTAVRIYPAILQAAAICGVSDLTQLSVPPFRMIKRTLGGKTEIFVETKLPDDTSLLILSTDSKLRVTHIDTGDIKKSSLPFKDTDFPAFSMVVLALLPHVLAIDKEKGNEKLQNAIRDLGSVLDGIGTAPWASELDVPDMAKDAAYLLDAVLTVLKDHLTLDCGDTRSDIPAELEINYFAQGTISGALLYENLSAGWTPKILIANGNASVFCSTRISVKEAQDKYAFFMSHRKWTAQERMMIPQLPEKMPVMPEVLRLADRIVNTKDDINPVCNVMWRGVTGFGKSTGVQQLACILGIPLLTITCHPNMEAQDFRSQFVPEGQTDGLPTNPDNYVAAVADAVSETHAPLYEDAMAYLQTLDADARAEVLDAKPFFFLAMMDPDAAAKKLLGKDQYVEAEDLCWLYSDVCAAYQKMSLKQKLAEYEALSAKEEIKQESKPNFIHVISPYLKAMANGYIIEIQEASRVRDSGVLVSLNEFNRPGAIMHLMDGGLVRRHKDALAIITDNVGYASCRPIDPSVIRRQDMIIDSYELPEELVKDRARANTGVTDSNLLDLGYKLWNCVREFCEQNAITEGSVSPVEYERFIQAMKYDGMDALATNLDECIISKASSSIEDQKDIRTQCQTIFSVSSR